MCFIPLMPPGDICMAARPVAGSVRELLAGAVRCQNQSHGCNNSGHCTQFSYQTIELSEFF